MVAVRSVRSDNMDAQEEVKSGKTQVRDNRLARADKEDTGLRKGPGTNHGRFTFWQRKPLNDVVDVG